MKFLFPSLHSNGKRDDSKNEKFKFQKNLFFSTVQNDEDDEENNDDEENGYSNEDEKTVPSCPKYYNLSHISFPLSDTIAEFVGDVSHEQQQFYLNDLSFIFELSRTQSVSPYAVIVALLYLRRLKEKQQTPTTTTSNPEMTVSNMELCLISIVRLMFFIF